MNFKFLWASLGLALVFGCADFSRGEFPPVPDAAVLPDMGTSENDAVGAETPDGPSVSSISFAAVHPLLVSACRDCHRSGGQAANTTLLLTGSESVDLATTLPYVNRNDAANSRLLTKATGRNHGGGATWAPGSSQAVTVQTWIQQGAQP